MNENPDLDKAHLVISSTLPTLQQVGESIRALQAAMCKALEGQKYIGYPIPDIGENMMTENLVQEARKFLEGLGYGFYNNWHGYFASIVSKYDEVEFEGGESEVVVDCLEHYLVSELGKHWLLVWQNTDVEYKLAPEIIGNIATAIEYLFALKKERI